MNLPLSYSAHLGTVANKLRTVVDLNRLDSITADYLRPHIHFNLRHLFIVQFLLALVCYSRYSVLQ